MRPIRIRIRRLAVVAAAILAPLAVGCSLLVDTSGLSGSADDGGAAAEAGSADADGAPPTGDAGADSGGDASGGDAPSGDAGDGGDAATSCAASSSVGPPLVQAGASCIDATEVSVAQYQAFLAAKGSDTSGQPAECVWNTSFALKCALASTDPNAAVACVNWCDAYAYCAWAGKRLCGKIGGGPGTSADVTNPAVDEWYQACSAGGTRAYPYGSTFQAGLCNDTTRAQGRPLAVGSSPACTGGYPGLFDMSGNVVEWEDVCTAGSSGPSSDTCIIRSGAWDDGTAESLACTLAFPQVRSTADNTNGFRCCGK